MKYTRREHKRTIINGIASSFIVAVFIGVLYDTKKWGAAIIVSGLYGIGAYWISWLIVKDRKKNKKKR